MAREHERRGLGREYLAEQRRAADDPRPDPDRDETACPFGRSWCDPSADLSTTEQVPFLSCWLQADRDDGGPHPDVAAVADKPATGD